VSPEMNGECLQRGSDSHESSSSRTNEKSRWRRETRNLGDGLGGDEGGDDEGVCSRSWHGERDWDLSCSSRED